MDIVSDMTLIRPRYKQGMSMYYTGLYTERDAYSTPTHTLLVPCLYKTLMPLITYSILTQPK